MIIDKNLEELELDVGNDELIKCQWCGEAFEKSELVKEHYLGYICWHCAKAIESRGEKLIFEE